MRAFTTLALLCLAACASPPPPATFPAAQALVDQIAGEHADLVRLTLHATPAGTDRARVVASTSAAKLNQWADPEDVDAMQTGREVVLDEGANLDYTLPVMADGKAIAAVGVTVKGAGRDAMLASAKAIAGQVSTALLAMPQLPW